MDYLKRHLKVFGSIGHSTFNSGYSIDEANAVGADIIHKASKQTLYEGCKVKFHNHHKEYTVNKITGIFLELSDDGKRIPFTDDYPSDAKYEYGYLKTSKSRVILV